MRACADFVIPGRALRANPESRGSQRQYVVVDSGFAHATACAPRNDGYSTSSGHGTMVDFTVFIAIASATARPIPSSENG
jgi:hypothetical protein